MVLGGRCCGPCLSGPPSPACLVLLPSGAGISRLSVGTCREGTQRAAGRGLSVLAGTGDRLGLAAFRAPDSRTGSPACAVFRDHGRLLLPLRSWPLPCLIARCPESYYSHSSLYVHLLSRKFSLHLVSTVTGTPNASPSVSEVRHFQCPRR